MSKKVADLEAEIEELQKILNSKSKEIKEFEENNRELIEINQILKDRLKGG